MKYFLNYLIAGVLVASAAISGSYFTSKNSKSSWYDCIKPKGTPPSFVFPIVWTTIYILLIIALGRSLALPRENILVILLFVANLAINPMWCWAYFSEKRIKLALMLILILAASIVAIMFASRDIVVSLLLLPYLAWISFATYLNFKSLEKEVECNPQ